MVDRHPRWKEILSQTFGETFDVLLAEEKENVLIKVEDHQRKFSLLNLRAAALDLKKENWFALFLNDALTNSMERESQVKAAIISYQGY